MEALRIISLRGVLAALAEAFWRPVNGVFGSGSPQAVAVRAAKAETIVRVYYAYLMALAYVGIGAAATSMEMPVQPNLGLALTAWIPHDSWRQIGAGLALFMLVASMLAAVIPRWRIPRILAIVSFLLLEAMRFDLDGKISHAALPLMWAGIAFCFLPSSRNDAKEHGRNYLASFFGAQVMVCLLYTCAGLSKVVGIALDWNSGVTWLDPEALPLMLAANWAPPRFYPAWEFLILNPWAAWLSNIGVLYLEIAAVLAVFRRRLHRPWAVGLLIMHAMVWLTMVIEFRQSAFTVGLILLASPFAPDKLELKETLLDLPLVRLVHQRLEARRRAGAATGHRRESSRRAPWVPSSMVMKLWIPLLVALYFGVAFGNLDRHGGFEPGSRQRQSRPGGEVYPISALPMFMRIPSGDNNVRKLKRIRRKLERANEAEVVAPARADPRSVDRRPKEHAGAAARAADAVTPRVRATTPRPR